MKNKKKIEEPSDFIKWLINPININYGKIQDELFKLKRENELLQMNIRAYQMMGLNVKSMADLELAQIKSTKIYRFIYWWVSLSEDLSEAIKNYRG